MVRDLIWRRATNLIWLDYGRAVVMYRVIKRSVARAFDQTELWAGNREDWRRWLRPSHPIRWAWSTWRERRSRFEALLNSAQYRHLAVLRLQTTCDAAKVNSKWVRRNGSSVHLALKAGEDGPMSRPSAIAKRRSASARNLVERSSPRSSSAVASQNAMTRCAKPPRVHPTWRQFGSGYGFMRPRPDSERPTHSSIPLFTCRCGRP